VVKKGVLDANGGEIGITVKNDFTDFEFYADFNMLSANKFAPNFVLRAKDKDNCTLVQIVADDRNQLWWFMRVGGGFNVDAKNFKANESGVQVELEKWYSIKLVAEGNRYELHLGKQGKELKLACTWEDKTHKRGSIGFREGGGEHCLYDNILVTTVGHNFAVNPHNNLPTVWGGIKGGE
ncbi:MAG: family 16 glycoside hydrolase, partial [Candidatus Poribacteria bacterium]